MKFEARFRPGDEVRAMWLAAAAVLLGGSFFVHNRYQTAIAASYDKSELLYRDTVADNRIAGQAAVLERILHRSQTDLSRISRNTTLSASTADLLATLHGSAARFHAAITAVQPVGDAVAPAAQIEPALEASPMTIRLRGKFRDVLGFVEDLSHHSTLISVSDTEMSVAADEAGYSEPQLDATVHATLYRLRLPDRSEVRVATAR